MDGLKKMALREIATSIPLLEPTRLMEEAFSVFASRQDSPTSLKIMEQLLTYHVGTQNSMTSTSSNSYLCQPPPGPAPNFSKNSFVIFRGSFHTAEAFSLPYYKTS